MSNVGKMPQSHRGFTLIEVLAVIIVIGIAAALVTFSVGDDARPRQIKASARQLYHAMNLAMEEAVFLNRQLGLRFDTEFADGTQVYGYEWLQYNAVDKAWNSVDDEEFKKQSLPGGVVLKLVVEQQLLVIGGDNNQEAELFEVKKPEDGKKPLSPDLYFLSSGETQNFTVSIADEELPDSEYIVSGNMLGQIEFRQPDAEK